jgi:hypothetical protein
VGLSQHAETSQSSSGNRRARHRDSDLFLLVNRSALFQPPDTAAMRQCGSLLLGRAQDATDLAAEDVAFALQASPDPAPRLGYSSSNLPLRQASSHLHLFKREFRNRLEGALLPRRGIAELPREEVSGKGPGACEGEESETRRVRNARSERRAEEVGLYWVASSIQNGET